MAIPSVVLTASTTINATTVCNLTITGTVNVDDVVYVYASVFNGAQNISAVSCTGSVNATIRVPKPSSDAPLQAAWATISTGTVNPVFQVTFGGNVNATIGALVIRGAAVPTNPFDLNPSQPWTRHDFANDHQGIYSTYTSDTLLLFGGFGNSNGAMTVPSGWTQQINAASSSRLIVATLGESSPVHSLVATMSGGPNARAFCDAIAGQAFTSPATPYAVISAAVYNSSTTSLALTLKGTALANDVVYVIANVFNGGNAISTVSCTGSSNAAKRAPTFNNGSQPAFATIDSTTVDPVFTVNFPSATNVYLMGIIVRGTLSPLSPFDHNAAIPAQTGTSTASYTTTDTNDLLIFGGDINSGSFDITAPSGWDLLVSCIGAGMSGIIATMSSTVTVSSLTATQTTSGPNPITDADALVGVGNPLSFPQSTPQRRHRLIR